MRAPGGDNPGMHHCPIPWICWALLVGAPLAQNDAAVVEPPRWWKGNLHTHSLWSDGNDFPESIARWYKQNGWDFLSFTDHNVLSRGERWMKVDDVVRRGGRKALANYRAAFGEDWVETRDGDGGKQEVRLRPFDEFRTLFDEPGAFLLIQGEEITDGFDGRPIHMNAIHVDDPIEPRHGTSVRRVMDRNLAAARVHAEEAGLPVMVHLNHPNFGWGVSAEDLAAVLEERFFEVYNGHPSVHHEGVGGRAGVERLWDIACTLRIDRYGTAPPFGLGTDDSHHYFTEGATRSISGRGWIRVRADRLEADSLMTAILAGEFYASSGVELVDVGFDGRALTVVVDGQDGVEYDIAFVGTREGHDRAVEPVRDDAGQALGAATWRYSEDVGEVLARASGASARYELRGDELYVRAVVTASVPPERPVFEGQMAQAWTQPVGWRRHVVPGRAVEFAAVACEGNWNAPLSGLAVDPRGSIYWAFGRDLVRTDARGVILARYRSELSIADLAWSAGEVWAIAETGALAAHDPSTLLPVADRVIEQPSGDATQGLAWVGATMFSVRRGGEELLWIDRRTSDVRTHFVDELEVALDEVAALAFAEGHLWVLERRERGSQLRRWTVDGREIGRTALGDAVALAPLPAGRYLVGRTDSRRGGWRGAVDLGVPGPDGGIVRVAR